jgi:hypothetical protein
MGRAKGDTHRYADTLPLRRVVSRDPEVGRYNEQVTETLECGHRDTVWAQNTAKRRRCWQCGTACRCRDDMPFGHHDNCPVLYKEIAAHRLPDGSCE